MTVDYSLMGGVPAKTEGIENPLPQNNTATPVTGWEDSPLIQELNKQSLNTHTELHNPTVQTIMKVASPDATGEDRINASKVLSNANFNTPSSDQTHWGELIKGIIGGDPKLVHDAWNGGADRREEGIDGTGKKYYKVFNQRGEFRRNEDINFRPLSPKEEEVIGGISSKSDMTQSQGAMYKALGANLQDISRTNSALYNQIQKNEIPLAYNSPTIVSAAKRNRTIAPQLYSASVDPATRAYITGIDTIGSGDTRAIENSAKAMVSHVNGQDKTENVNKSIDNSGGINFGLQYKEGTGWVDGNGKVQTEKDIMDRANQLAKSQNSTASITARKDDLASKAQIIAAKTGVNLDLINEYLNNNYQIALAKKEIEESGGVPGIKPNLPHSVMDSFQAGHIKSIQDETYGKIASMYANFIAEKKKALRPGQVPDVSQWVLEFNRNPEIAKLKLDNAEEANRIHHNTPNKIQATDVSKISPALVSTARATTPNITEAEVSTPDLNKTTTKPKEKKANVPSLNDILKVK